jgi:hypothetical protein
MTAAMTTGVRRVLVKVILMGRMRISSSAGDARDGPLGPEGEAPRGERSTLTRPPR